MEILWSGFMCKLKGESEMQEKTQQIIWDFVNLLSDEIEKSVTENISINEIAKYKNILVIRSAKNKVMHDFLEKLLSESQQIKVNILGGALERDFLNRLFDTSEAISYQSYAYDGRFDVNRMKEFKHVILAENPDVEAIVFLNYYPHTERYINIEEVASCFARDKKLPIYSYTDSGDIFKYVDIETHLQAISLYLQLVRWFHE